jgi:signal transduction histidine kinase
MDLSAYRIVQEGLTNSLKHAKANSADITVRYGGDDLELEVRDNGVGAATSDWARPLALSASRNG